MEVAAILLTTILIPYFCVFKISLFSLNCLVQLYFVLVKSVINLCKPLLSQTNCLLCNELLKS